jgi:hypothetical protein
MEDKNNLSEWILEALKAHNGQATIVQVSKHIWEHHQQDLQKSGDLFYTWQYNIRWEKDKLQKQNKLAKSTADERGIWKLL